MHRAKRALLLLAAIGALAPGLGSSETSKPKSGFVPDQATAIKIAEAAWLPLYGDAIYKRKPFVANLKGDVWLVKGSLPRDAIGGVPEAEISRTDGRVIRVSHGQ